MARRVFMPTQRRWLLCWPEANCSADASGKDRGRHPAQIRNAKFTDVPGLPGRRPAFIGGFCVSGASNSSAHRIGRGSPNSSRIAPIARNGKGGNLFQSYPHQPREEWMP